MNFRRVQSREATLLSMLWPEMTEHDRLRFVKSLVGVEPRMFCLSQPASGSLYFLLDLPPDVQKLAVDRSDCERAESLYIGPSTSLDLRYGKRSGLDVYREPRKTLLIPVG
jgi:hypothetical protein